MNQTIHIFRKDTRRCWPEVLLSLAAIAALICAYPLRWSVLPAASLGAESEVSMNLAVLCTCLVVLVVASWAVFISRIIHAESLVGNKQFWLTLPYEWKSLLAAKWLFLAVYLYLPLVVAQWLLLDRAGLASRSTVPGLLFNLLLITGFLVLPLVAIAAITGNFFRMAFTLLGAGLVGIGAVVAITLPHYSNGHNNTWNRLVLLAMDNLAAPAHSLTSVGHHKQLLFALLFAAVCGVIVLLQYARRQTRVSWMILLALPIAIAAGGAVKAHYALSGQAQIDRDYPALPASAAPIELSPAIDTKHQLTVFRGNNNDAVPIAAIGIPFHVSEIAEGTALVVDHQRVTIEAADGFHWSAEVHGLAIEQYILPGARTRDGIWRPRAFFEMPYAIYKRVKTGPVTVRITLAITQLQAANSVTVTMPEHEVAVPGFGICNVETVGYGAMQCRSALREPEITYVSASGWSDTSCAVPGSEIQLTQVNPWPGLLDREPAEFGIVPIQFVQASYSWGYRGAGTHLCAGAPVTFTHYKLKGRMQVNLTIPNLYFPPENPASNIDHSDGRPL